MNTETRRTWNIKLTPPGEPITELTDVSEERTLEIVLAVMHGRPVDVSAAGDDRSREPALAA